MPVTQKKIDAVFRIRYVHSVVNLRYKFQIPMLIGMIVFWGLFKINLLSAGWNILAGIVITAVIFVVTGLINNQD